MLTTHESTRERGQSLVELAISMPLLLLLMLGTIDMGRVFFDYIDMRNAAVEGATYGSRKPADTAGITAAVMAHGLPADSSVSVSTSGDCATPNGAGNISVTASRIWTPISLGVLQVIGKDVSWSFTINAKSTMRCLT